MRRRLIALGIAAVVAGLVVTAAAARSRIVAGGCGATQLRLGTMPSWTAPAMSDSSSGASPWRYASSRRRNVVAIVFGYPLRAGNAASGRANKILWIMRLPRLGLPLHISARPLSARGPVIHEAWPADSSPGQIYPSYLNVPRPGCWRVSLHWAGHSDQLDLRYGRS